MLAGLALLGVVLLAGAVLGAADAGWNELVALFTSPEAGTGERIIAIYRLPRMVVAMQVGVHFALAGLIFQVVLRNPLADPTVLGVSGGASLAVVIAMTWGAGIFVPEATAPIGHYLPMGLVPFIALAGGLIAGGLVLWLSWDGDLDPTRTALSGVALGAVASAAVMAMVLAMGNSQAEVALIWLAGSLYGRSYEDALAVLPWTCAGLVAAILILRPLGASRFDADIARSFGLDTRLWRPLALAIAVALAASAVSIVGPVGFVGLVVPHTARLVVGISLPRQMAFGAVFGALLVATSDILGRVVAVPVEVPVGAVTSLIGVPIFLVLLHRRSRGLG
jgi:iron complex transport system permease protein